MRIGTPSVKRGSSSTERPISWCQLKFENFGSNYRQVIFFSYCSTYFEPSIQSHPISVCSEGVDDIGVDDLNCRVPLKRVPTFHDCDTKFSFHHFHVYKHLRLFQEGLRVVHPLHKYGICIPSHPV
jgi:hypothetical protein